MKNSNLCSFGFIAVLSFTGCLPGCDSGSSNYAELHDSLSSFQNAAAKTVDNMVAVQESLVALAATEVLNDKELDAAIAQFNEAVDALGNGAQAIVEAETKIQNALRDLQGGAEGTGIVQQALKVRDVANVLTGGITGLADKMDSNRKAMNVTYDELYEAYAEGDMDAIDAAKGKIKALGTDTLFSWLKKTTTTLVSAPVGAVVEGVKKGAVVLKFAAKTAVSKVWAKGCDVIAGPKECAEGIDAQGCSVSFNRTDEEGRAEVPAGDVTIFVSGKDLARVRLDEIPIAQDEEKEIILPETPIGKADDKNLANGEIPQPEEEEPLDTENGTDAGGNERSYILCYISDPNDNYTTHYACRPFEGSLNELNQLSVNEVNALCAEAGYEQFWGTHTNEKSCIEECLYFVCDTPE